MKLSHAPLIVLGLASGAMLLPFAARAQSPSPEPPATPSVSAPTASSASDGTAAPRKGGEHKGAMKARLAALTPAEREQLKAAHEKAMQDPAVTAAEPNRKTDPKAFRQAMHAAMLRADPTIGPILEKMRQGGGHHGEVEESETPVGNPGPHNN